MLSTHRTGLRHHFHYIRPSVTAAYVRRIGPRHGTSSLPTLESSIKLTAGPNIDITQAAGNEMESQVAVNPTDPKNIVIVAQNDIDGGKTINYCVTTDGGLTWERTTIGADEDGFSPDTNRADARVIFDAYGNLYCTYMVSPSSGAVDIICLYSFDKGQTLGDMDIPVTGYRYNPDSPWLATGPSATHPGQQAVWMSFTDEKSRLILLTGVTSSGPGRINMWSMPADVSDGFGTYSTIAIGPAGQIAVAWQQNELGKGYTPLLFNIDTTGTGNGFGPDEHLFNTSVGGFDPIPAQRLRGIDAEVKLAYDRSPGTANGRLYLAYTDASATDIFDTNIELRYSDNNGRTFSRNALRINDDAGANSQFLPALAVDPKTGDVGITWYDARNSSDNTAAEMFAAVSEDNGLTFSKNVQIAADLTDQNWKGPSTNDLDFGDNNSVAFLGGKLIAVWSDNSNATGGNPQGGHSKLDVEMDVVTVS